MDNLKAIASPFREPWDVNFFQPGITGQASYREIVMKETLKEVVAQVVNNPNSTVDLAFEYKRGHDLSGMTSFEFDKELAFQLESNNPRKQTFHSYSGQLTIEQHRALLTIMQNSSFFDISSSTRNIGDDEIPITIEVSIGDVSHQLEIWQRDAKNNKNYVQFDSALSLLLMELSDGNIKH